MQSVSGKCRISIGESGKLLQTVMCPDIVQQPAPNSPSEQATGYW